MTISVCCPATTLAVVALYGLDLMLVAAAATPATVRVWHVANGR